MRKMILLAAACAVMLWVGTVQASMTDEQKCLSGRAKAKGKYEQCIEKWLAKVYGGGFDDYTKALEKLAMCRIRYNATWNKLRGLGTTCAVSSRYMDNLNGTVTDNLTGLVWEQKTTLVGSGQNFGDPRDVDNTYTWNSSFAPWAENGTAYTDFLENLNAGGGFAAANAWRLPTFAELQTILLPEEYPCTTNPCIDQFYFVSTQSNIYRSATTHAADPSFAWSVNFSDGYANAYYKPIGYYTRAVRGGL